MPKIRFVEPNGEVHDVEAPLGASVMQVAMDNMVRGIVADCGGSCTCGTCHAYVCENWLVYAGSASDEEIDLLEGVMDPKPNSRLTCQLKISELLDGAIFYIPKAQY